ncbi:MAG: L-glutamine-phosphate cytidylyltransferase [Phycisphaerales bacterium]|nr:L-glutamine-phosphate cytidylyltransferase [Phycisphaerales bacterium]
MNAIIIGAGRGSRLKAMTDTQPKCYVTIGGVRILDWTLEAFDQAGLHKKIFIGGYQIEQIRRDYPQLTFAHNADWQNNNILLSLFHAEQHMADGFVCAYSDILFRDSVVRDAMNHPADIVVCVDTRWRDRYIHRSEHPEGDAEKVIVEGDRVKQIHRDIAADKADGEYIGVAKFSPRGAAMLREHFHRVKREFTGRPWREAKVFEKAYFILLIQEMIEHGVPVHFVATHGDYAEIDTEEDYRLANDDWPKRFPKPA